MMCSLAKAAYLQRHRLLRVCYSLFRQTGRPCLRELSCLGHCRIMDTSSHSSQNPGTFSYAAPELLFNQKLDVKVRLAPGKTCNVLPCHRQELQVPAFGKRAAGCSCCCCLRFSPQQSGDP